MNTVPFYLFTGGPGVGKTTVLQALQARGYHTVPEVARAIIQSENAQGGNATHQGDRIAYRDKMLAQSIADYTQHRAHLNTCQKPQDLRKTQHGALCVNPAPLFFDRGLPDLYSYTARFCEGSNMAVHHAIAQYRYHPYAFLFPPWPEIYCLDNERQQTYTEALETFHAIQAGYNACAYTLITVPKCSVEERVDFIISTIHNIMHPVSL